MARSLPIQLIMVFRQCAAYSRRCAFWQCVAYRPVGCGRRERAGSEREQRGRDDSRGCAYVHVGTRHTKAATVDEVALMIMRELSKN